LRVPWARDKFLLEVRSREEFLGRLIFQDGIFLLNEGLGDLNMLIEKLVGRRVVPKNSITSLGSIGAIVVCWLFRFH